jgi:hypothetical protein
MSYAFLSFSNSCYGQTLEVSTYIGETLYSIFLAVLGLILFAHLIGNVQVFFYLIIMSWKFLCIYMSIALIIMY